MGLKVTAVGRLGRDAEVKTVGQNQVVEFTLACDEGFGDRKVTNWLRCSWWGNLAAKMLDHMKKGKPFIFYGNLKLRPYTDKDGNEKISPDLEVTGFDFTGAPRDEGSGGGESSGPPPAAPDPSEVDEEMPF
jgi:single-strand DNA-binding protein